MRARLQLVLSVDYDLLVGLEAGINVRLAVTDLRDLHRADCYGVVRIDHVSVGSFRTLLHDRCRNSQAVMPRIEKQPRVDKFAGPELVRAVAKIRLELDRAGSLQDLVVNKAELAFIQEDRIILVVGKDRERRLGSLLLLLDLRQARLRQREYQRNPMELRDDDAVGWIGRDEGDSKLDLTN